jgi:predicted AlkP superfamily phosphohydrolase/phosphomutase
MVRPGVVYTEVVQDDVESSWVWDILTEQYKKSVVVHSPVSNTQCYVIDYLPVYR